MLSRSRWTRTHRAPQTARLPGRTTRCHPWSGMSSREVQLSQARRSFASGLCSSSSSHSPLKNTHSSRDLTFFFFFFLLSFFSGSSCARKLTLSVWLTYTPQHTSALISIEKLHFSPPHFLGYSSFNLYYPGVFMLGIGNLRITFFLHFSARQGHTVDHIPHDYGT